MKMAWENNVVVAEPGGWAVLKLFPAWHHEREPRFAVDGGHLYRRGQFGWLSEAGAVSHPDERRAFKRGDAERVTLRLTAVPAASSGHQLAVRGDGGGARGTVDALRHFYGATFNDGCVNDPLRYTCWPGRPRRTGHTTIRLTISRPGPRGRAASRSPRPPCGPQGSSGRGRGLRHWFPRLILPAY
jgi:hypothetical protein